MGFQNPIKTEHNGAKHGKGAYYGHKYEAKKASSKARRINNKNSINEQLIEDGK